ncbi:MAG: universal stress protein [Chloroflexi bacterium]|nr:universal stress protein [Chloroflexota bacterium]
MAHVVSRKLSNSFEGALAGGGDPATSPLYVFGPFLKLIVAAGVAEVTFGASIWLVLLTVAVVAAMYRLVMRWVTDGSGGSGLTEEEFGGWAVKINAGITFIEYTLTFLVSVAALVTFIADRFAVLNEPLFLGLNGRVIVAILLSVLTGWIVNLGPKWAARVFGPATLAVLALLWAMNIATIWKLGLHLPAIHLKAFVPPYLHYTLAGYARILALMTGIEVFANLVAAYEGTPEEKAKKAFGSLLIIMGSTAATMLITGPAIFKVADPMNEHVSVFTQTMDYLLPDPLPYVGTLIGVVVLLSASAASAQGIQNLALGLKDRHYIPPVLGRRNKYGVADMPVWLEVAIVSLMFLIFGTSEETYLSLYAAGVFILLSMTSWAVMKRLLRELRQEFDVAHALTLAGSLLAALLTTIATIIIFAERLHEGAWMYFVLIPLLYVAFTYFRNKLGDPHPLKERLGELEEAMWGIGIPGGEGLSIKEEEILILPAEGLWQPMPAPGERWRGPLAKPKHVLVPLDGSPYSERVLPLAALIARTYDAKLTLVSVLRMGRGLIALPSTHQKIEAGRREREAYLKQVADRLRSEGIQVEYTVGVGPVAETINSLAQELGVDLLIVRTHGRSGVSRWVLGSTATKILQLSVKPVLLVPLTADKRAQEPRFRKILVPLDGSEFAERVLPYVRALDRSFRTEIILLHVPVVPEADLYGPMADLVQELREQAVRQASEYLEAIVAILKEEGHNARALITGSEPAATILEVSEKENVDVVMMATHGRGGLDRVFMGSTAERLAQNAKSLLFLVPIHEKRAPS